MTIQYYYDHENEDFTYGDVYGDVNADDEDDNDEDDKANENYVDNS